MQAANKFKRPCEQCRASLTYGISHGEYPEGYSGLQHAGCCGSWAIVVLNSKATYRRPTRSELGRLGLGA